MIAVEMRVKYAQYGLLLFVQEILSDARGLETRLWIGKESKYLWREN